MQEGDMIVSLAHLPSEPDTGSVRITRAFVGDKSAILRFVQERFSAGWLGEAECALLQTPPKCFVAVRDGQVAGFACYDASARGFFGPLGVDDACRGQGVGTALLLRTLGAMRGDGYAYAVIGWVSDAADFYEKTVGAVFIPGGMPGNSVYGNRINGG